MNDKEAGEFWNKNAEAWTALSQGGYDIYRDHLNTPAFFKMLPDVGGITGLDIGCGDGHNTKLLAQKGALMSAIDISKKFIEYARENNSYRIKYLVASATELPFEKNSFDFATSFMCLMDVPDSEKALEEVSRVLKPNGFFQFSIAHPCFTTPHRKNLRNISGKSFAIEVGDYFKSQNGKIDEWIFGTAPQHLKNKYSKFQIPIFNKTLTQWINTIIKAGLTIEEINEPYADNETVKKYPALQDTQTVAYFLHVRCRKKE